jgi:hypothetical protein
MTMLWQALGSRSFPERIVVRAPAWKERSAGIANPARHDRRAAARART